jgi:hypothetical protein
MSIPDFNNLFQDSGPQGILDFLLSKIEVNDLSQEEALAMLSAVHEEMTEKGGNDPKIFQSYNNFMKFLEREKPELFEFVVANWKDKKDTIPSARRDQGADIDGTDSMEDSSKTTETKSDVGFKEVKETGDGAIGEEETQEPGESEEDSENQTGTTRKGGEDEIEPEESSEEPEQEDDDVKDEKKDDETDSNEDESEEVKEDTETKESEETEEEQPESEEIEPEIELEIEPNEQPEESAGESEEGGTEGESGGDQEETEWPEMEQPQSGEVNDGLEGESETPPGEE